MLPYSRKLNDTGRKRIETTSRHPAAKNTTTRRMRSAPALSPFGANSSLRKPIGPDACSPHAIHDAKKTSAIASVMFTSALPPRNSGCSMMKPSAVRWPHPIEPTPGIRPVQFEARMKMKMLPKNQNVRSTRGRPIMPSRNRYSDSTSHSRKFCAPSGTCRIDRVAP